MDDMLDFLFDNEITRPICISSTPDLIKKKFAVTNNYLTSINITKHNTLTRNVRNNKINRYRYWKLANDWNL